MDARLRKTLLLGVLIGVLLPVVVYVSIALYIDHIMLGRVIDFLQQLQMVHQSHA